MRPPEARPSAAKAGAWSALDVVVRQAILFLVSVALARLLTPEDFGIIALLALFTNLSAAFVQGGLAIAIIQRQRTTDDEESAIFWWNLAGSILFGLLIVSVGPALAAFFRQPVLKQLVFVAAAQLAFAAAGGVHSAILTKEMRFDLLTKCSLFSSLASGAVAVTAAFMGAGVWALALQILSLALFNTVALWIGLNWRPKLHFRFDTIRHLFGFGAWVSAGTVLEVLYTNGLSLLIGKLHGVRQLGFYNQASATQLLPSSALSSIVSRVALPLLASNQHDAEATRGNLRLAIRSVMVVNVPAMAGLALLSDLIVTVLFGPSWLPAAPILSILALGGILYPLHAINGQFVLSRGHTGTYLRLEITKKGAGIACVVIGSFFGLIGLAWSQVVYSAIGLVINAGPARQHLRYGPFRQLSDLAWIGGVTCLMAVTVLLIRTMLTTDPPVTLVTCAVTGTMTYAIFGWLSPSAAFRQPFELLRELFLGVRA